MDYVMVILMPYLRYIAKDGEGVYVINGEKTLNILNILRNNYDHVSAVY